jgi:hypothetical protein
VGREQWRRVSLPQRRRSTPFQCDGFITRKGRTTYVIETMKPTPPPTHGSGKVGREQRRRVSLPHRKRCTPFQCDGFITRKERTTIIIETMKPTPPPTGKVGREQCRRVSVPQRSRCTPFQCDGFITRKGCTISGFETMKPTPPPTQRSGKVCREQWRRVSLPQRRRCTPFQCDGFITRKDRAPLSLRR